MGWKSKLKSAVGGLGGSIGGMFSGGNSGGLGGILHKSGIDFLDITGNTARDFNAEEAEKARNFNAEQAEIQRQWEERMSNTAHQREMADLKAAGLNPIIAAGGGANVPSGASATGPAATTEQNHSLSGLVGLLSSIASLQNTANQTKLTNEQVEKMKAEEKRIKHDLKIDKEIGASSKSSAPERLIGHFIKHAPKTAKNLLKAMQESWYLLEDQALNEDYKERTNKYLKSKKFKE